MKGFGQFSSGVRDWGGSQKSPCQVELISTVSQYSADDKECRQNSARGLLGLAEWVESGGGQK